MVRAHLTTPKMRRLVLSELVARAVKNDLRYQLREKMREMQLPCIEPFKVTRYH